MEKLQLPPRETAFILITSDKERDELWAPAARVNEALEMRGSSSSWGCTQLAGFC